MQTFKTRVDVAVAPPTEPPRDLVRACLVVLGGAELGRVHPLPEGPVVIGRSPAACVRLDVNDVSRFHARIGREGNRWVLTDLGSRNGTRVNGEPIRRATLRDGDKVRLGISTVLRFSMPDAIEADFQRRVFDFAARDALTGVFNRRYCLGRLRAEAAFARRHGTPLSVLLLDLDRFKAINDRHGHAAGDRVLEAIGGAIARTVRVEDIVARWGGEEFLVLCRGIPAGAAAVLAERILRIVEGLAARAPGGVAVRPTASIGVAELPIATGSVEPPAALDRITLDVVQRADRAMYAAKAAGGNRASVAPDEPPSGSPTRDPLACTASGTDVGPGGSPR